MDLFKKSRKKDGKKVDTKAGDGSDTDPSRPSTPQRQAKASGSGSEIRKFFSRSPRASKKVISDQTFEADVTDVAKSPIEPTHVDRNDEDPNDIPELTLFVFDPKT
ncbi:hypothetical protein FRB91_007245 [Serendipita sp. 411]|nr:hypothetical protein FRB91_007245 [Serendipita sp. 411]